MSRLDDLLAQHCPDGVEYKELGTIGTFYGGLSGKTKDDFGKGDAKYITYMNVYSNLSVDTYIFDRVDVAANEKQNTVAFGDVLFTGSSETPDECGMSSVMTYTIDENVYLNSFCFGYRFDDADLMLPDFSKYVFRSEALRKQIKKTASGVTRFNVSKKKMEKVSIPLPPLPVQAEIVRILDNFTELTAELTARRKQYEYYRDQLLTFGDEVGWTTLGLLGSFYGGLNGKTKSDFGNGNARFITYMNVYSNISVNTNIFESVNIGVNEKQNAVAYGDVIFTGSSETSDECGMSSVITAHLDESVYLNSFCFGFRFNDSGILLPEFTKYLFRSDELRKQIKKTASGVTRFNVSKKKMEYVSIPLPPLAEQQRIVNILDRFESLCNDITSGLPAEIEARRKQYEYYRDKLLAFEERVSG